MATHFDYETAEEMHYDDGRRSAWLSMLQECVRELGIDDPGAAHAAWIAEREAVVRKLREVCEDYGDNDWPRDLNLGDVIEKHLMPYLDAAEDDE